MDLKMYTWHRGYGLEDVHMASWDWLSNLEHIKKKGPFGDLLDPYKKLPFHSKNKRGPHSHMFTHKTWEGKEDVDKNNPRWGMHVALVPTSEGVADTALYHVIFSYFLLSLSY